MVRVKDWYHPDRLGGGSSSESGVKKFLEVDAAWKVLSDQTSRRHYDMKRREQELKQDWTVDSTVYLQDMTWDSDECEYTYCCRCGGRFSVSKEEVEQQQAESILGDDEVHKATESGVLVCCDTCSLTIFVALNDNIEMSK
ncbi:PREDICTED: dnaJ homolog subfamily C member 24 [Cyprinodon variegatus]|uniref:dnaJ homolog subfamily C member 24 n=1 Tax=Cyprinodon variegatus TaxID=28743 RepID=UPI000742530C|nr:PREDICTED: dnaJ homolog subfamily C member 24 [Cyprinodon variegatus]